MINSIFETEEMPESLNYAGELLGFTAGDGLFESMALAHAISLMQELGLHKEINKCIAGLERVSNTSEEDEALLIADMNLMNIAAVLGKLESFEAHRSNVETALLSDLVSPLIDVIPYYVLSDRARIKGAITNLEAYAYEAEVLFEQLNFFHEEIEDYAFVFLPILQKIKDVIQTEDLVEFTENLIEYAKNPTDKLAFYDFLINDFKLEKADYPEIFKRHYELLFDYYKSHSEEEAQDTKNKLISYKIERRFIKNASTDTLTGMGNRYAYKSALQRAQSELMSKTGMASGLAIIVADINGLKETNDTFGHQAGDELIRNAARCLNLAFGDIGEVFRIGGDEFTVIVKAEKTDLEAALTSLKALSEEAVNSFGVKLYIAVGYAAASDYPNGTVDELVDIADKKMYADKDKFYEMTGKNRR